MKVPKSSENQYQKKYITTWHYALIGSACYVTRGVLLGSMSAKLKGDTNTANIIIYVGESIIVLGGFLLMFYLCMFVNLYYTTLTESCPRSYYKVYKDNKELYYISAKFIKLLIKKTIDVPRSEKILFLNNYQDKKLTKKTDEMIKKYIKEEDVVEDAEIEKSLKEADNMENY